MRQTSGRISLYLALWGLLGACSGGGGRAGDAGTDLAINADVGADLATNQETCQGIRACLWGCTTGMQTCVESCVDKGSAEAQAVFQALATCALQYCPIGDFTCGCEQQCYAEGNCLVETEACVGAATADIVCEQFCH